MNMNLKKEKADMKKIEGQLKTVSDALVTISKQLEQIAKALDFSRPVIKAAKKTVAKQTKTNKTSSVKQLTVLDTVFDKIKRAKNGMAISRIQEKTGLGDRQLSNALYKLSKKGKILSKSRGVYIKNKDYREK